MKRFIVTSMLATLALIGASCLARAELIARYECNLVGAAANDPVGDKPGHILSTATVSCVAVDGLLKGAVYTNTAIMEWDGPKAAYLVAYSVHKAPDGIAFSQATEGTGTAVIKDGKFAGTETSAKGVFKFASGSLAKLSGRTFTAVGKPLGLTRGVIELTD